MQVPDFSDASERKMTGYFLFFNFKFQVQNPSFLQLFQLELYKTWQFKNYSNDILVCHISLGRVQYTRDIRTPLSETWLYKILNPWVPVHEILYGSLLIQDTPSILHTFYKRYSERFGSQWVSYKESVLYLLTKEQHCKGYPRYAILTREIWEVLVT